MEEVLGVDIGGVIIDRADGTTDTSFFGGNHLKTPEVPGAFDTIRALSVRFQGKVYLVSKCGKQTEERTLQWLDYRNFYERTGVLRSSIHFCRERHEKAPICEQLKVTHFVDDRLEVLGYLERVKHRFLFRPNEKEVRGFRKNLDLVTRVESWEELRAKLL